MLKYLPLLWSALWRKPADAMLSLMAVTTAFTLFGLMTGAEETNRRLIENTRENRIYINPRFPAKGSLTIGMRDMISRIPGVTAVGAFDGVGGYYRDPRNFVVVAMVDEGARHEWTDLPFTPAQWDQLLSTPTGVFASEKVAARWGLKSGSIFPVISPGSRADGAPAWEFHVLGIVRDVPQQPGGFIFGNYNYLDNSRPADKHGSIGGLQASVSDPARAVEISRQIDKLFANSGTPTLSVPARAEAEALARSDVAVAAMTAGVSAAGLFMILFLTANGIAQSVRERTPELAVLRSIGFQQRAIMLLVLAEALVPALLSAFLGTAFAMFLSSWPRTLLPEGVIELPEPTFSVTVLGWALLCAVVVAAVGTVIPILRLNRMDVAKALAR